MLHFSQPYAIKLGLAVIVVISLFYTLTSTGNLVITTSLRVPFTNDCVIKYFSILLSVDNVFGDTYKWKDCRAAE